MVHINKNFYSHLNKLIDSSANSKGKGVRRIDEVDENCPKQPNKKIKLW